MNIRVPSFFLPNLDFFAQLIQAENYTIDSNAKYTKQSFANRCYIRGPHKIERLVIPIRKPDKHTTVQNVKIAYEENWQQTNWRTICNCYRKAAYFEFFEPYFKRILLDKTFENLVELNTECLSLCLKLMQARRPIRQEICENDAIMELNYKSELQHSPKFRPFSYTQNFGSDFVPNLSIIDLLFCKGPETRDILHKSIPNEHL